MELDPDNWSPLSVDAIAGLFRPMPVRWWIAGGWALDLFLGEVTREHGDIDALILQRDQLLVQKSLRDEWELFKTHQPTPSHLAPWPDGEFLEPPVTDIWVRRPGTSAWSFQIMLMETDGEEWVYRRLRSIRGPMGELGLRTDGGVPYLRPDIQLLYKAGSSLAKSDQGYRAKNFRDLERVLPALSAEQVEWLSSRLKMQYPEGHEWLEFIERMRLSGH
jgi:hypothetical protein